VRQVEGISESFDYEFPASSVTFIRMRTADAVAPVVDRLEVAGEGVNGWYAEPATVRVGATDDRDVVARLEVSVDDGPWRTVEGSSGEVTVSGDGLHTVAVRAVDAAGNVGEVRPLTVGIDARAPVTRATLDGRTVTLAAADAGSGVDRVDYRLGDGPWTAYDAPVQVGATATVVGFRAVDRLGNVEPAGVLEVPASGAQLAATATAAVTDEDGVRLGRPARVSVSVTSDGSSPTGAVTVVDGSGALASGTLVDGRATLRVDTADLGVGSHPLTVRYAGDATHAPSQDTVTLEVVKARSRTDVVVKHRSPSARKAVVVARVRAAVAATGTVRVTVRTSGTSRSRTVALRDGKARLVLRGLARGTHRITVAYAGSPDVAPSRASTVLRVTRPEGKN
jgi:hypothetical protein